MHRSLRGPLSAVALLSLALAAAPPAFAAPTHAKWVAAADAVCTKANVALVAAIRKTGINLLAPTPAQLKTVAGFVVKSISTQKTQIAKLPAPSADQPAIKKLLATLQGAVDKIKADPNMVTDSESSTDANELAKALGLEACDRS